MLNNLSLISLLACLTSPAVQALAIRQTSTPVWQTLPPTPDLPTPINTTTTSVNGVQLWLQKYNEAAGGTPLVLDHGGLGYSAYFGSVITRLIANGHYVVALDRRGHGRSTFATDDVFTYDQFAQDIFLQLRANGIETYNVVGWSDGGITTLAALLNNTISQTIQKAFVFGASAAPEDTNATFSETSIFSEFVSRCAVEYSELQPGANFTAFARKVGTMEATLPHFSNEDLGRIDGAKVTVVGAEHEEAVNLDVAAKLNAAIKGSKLVTLTGVSHFAPLQDPDQFAQAIEDFLAA